MKIAIVSDAAMYSTFTSTLTAWYPTLNITHGFNLNRDPQGPVNIIDLIYGGAKEFFIHYETEAALSQYVTNKLYGTTQDHPIIIAAIQFNSVPLSNDGIGSWDYSIRLNSTHINTNGGASVLGYTVDTSAQVLQTTTRYLDR